MGNDNSNKKNDNVQQQEKMQNLRNQVDSVKASMENDNSKKKNDNVQQQEKMQNLRNQVDSVKEVMVDNVERILERGERLDNIERRTEQLNATSANFKFTARKVQRKFCMLNAKWTIILAIVILIVFTVLLLLILHWTGVIGKRNND